MGLGIVTPNFARAAVQDPPPAAVETTVEIEPPPAPLTEATQQDSGAFDTVEDQVQQRVASARVAFTSGRYDDAIRELQAAYKLKPNPNYLFSIAQSHRRAGRNREALAVYQRFLKESPETPLKLETLNYVSELTTLINREDAIEREKRRPLTKRAWFWGVLASSTVAGAVVLGVGLGVGLKDNTQTIGFSFPTDASKKALTIAR